MKVRPFGIVIVILVMVLSLSFSAWCTETSTPEAAPAATEEKPIQTPAPVAPETAPAAAPEKPAETAAPAVPTAEPEAQTTIQIEDAVVCQDVVESAPVGSGDVFAKETQKVYCFSRVVGALGETQVTHNWYYKDTLKASVKLPVRSNNWRTWSSKTILPKWTGEWMVEILSEEGAPLESIIFVIQ